MSNLRQKISNTISDLVVDFLYYDRKGDDELGVGDIDQAVKDDVISVDEMVYLFRAALVEGLV